jgi:Acetyltransferase (GNAT) domain
MQNSCDSPSEWCLLGSETTADRYFVQVATTVRAVELFRPTWRKWAHSVDTDIDYYLYQLSQYSANLEPYVVMVYKCGVAQAMLVGQVRKQRVSTIVSFVNIPGPTARVLEIKRGGRIGQPSPEIDRLLARELLKAAKNGEVDSISFERLAIHCGLFQEMQRVSGFLIKERVPHVFCYSVLSLTASERKRRGVFSGKIGREIRRKTRIAERAFPDQIKFKCFSQLSELHAGMCDAMRVAVTTWQSYLGLGFIDNARTRENLRFCAKRGWLRIYVLYIQDSPCAFLVGQLYNNTFHCQYAGYHPNYTRFSVGSLLTSRAFEDLAAAGVERVDLGEGGQEHNRRLGCELSEEATVHIYSPTLRGLCLNMFFGTTLMIRKGGRKSRSALRLNRAAKIWTQFLLSRRKSRNPLQIYREACDVAPNVDTYR